MMYKIRVTPAQNMLSSLGEYIAEAQASDTLPYAIGIDQGGVAESYRCLSEEFFYTLNMALDIPLELGSIT